MKLSGVLTATRTLKRQMEMKVHCFSRKHTTPWMIIIGHRIIYIDNIYPVFEKKILTLNVPLKHASSSYII